MRLNRLSVALIGAFFMAFAVSLPALAHDGFIVADFSDFTPQEFEHPDVYPFKGAVDVTVTNSGTVAWADFHFEIYQVPFGDPVDTVDFVTDIVGEDDWRPRKDGALVAYHVDNVVVGATLDLYFPGDQVLPTQTVNLRVYTDNTTEPNVGIFGILLYPTPIPEPATMALIGVGALALLLRRRKR